ncbi:MAG: TetR/AcrR family transcriptional regulator [Gammaproteobacteria bacterium]
MPRARKVSKGELSRAKLLEAAARVFVRKGFGQTTIRDIATEAGVALGALYFHFPSKDEFATAVFEQAIRAIWDHVEQDVAALPPGTDARTRIEAALLSHVLATVDHGDYAAAIRFARDSLAPKAVQRRYRQNVDRYRQFWQAMIEQGQRDGSIRSDLSAGKVLFFLFGAVNWLSEWHDPQRSPVESMVGDFATMLFEGIRPAKQ